MKVELKILDPRLPGWGFPRRGSELAAGLDLHACIDAPLLLEPQHLWVGVPGGWERQPALELLAKEWGRVDRHGCTLRLPPR